jgi:hypothetical protein
LLIIRDTIELEANTVLRLIRIAVLALPLVVAAVSVTGCEDDTTTPNQTDMAVSVDMNKGTVTDMATPTD